jgi:hypothetical protein
LSVSTPKPPGAFWNSISRVRTLRLRIPRIAACRNSTANEMQDRNLAVNTISVTFAEVAIWKKNPALNSA